MDTHHIVRRTGGIEMEIVNTGLLVIVIAVMISTERRLTKIQKTLDEVRGFTGKPE
jgi:hypothetical protein